MRVRLLLVTAVLAIPSPCLADEPGPRAELSAPSAPPLPPTARPGPMDPPPPRPDPTRYVLVGFDLGSGVVIDAHDSPWAVISRVRVGLAHGPLRAALAVEGGMLAEAFSHLQPTLRICAEPGLGLPLSRELELRVGGKACVGAARLRAVGQDVWRYGLAAGGFVAGALRLSRRVRLTARLDADAWAPDALGDDRGLDDRSWAAVLAGGLGVELRF